MFDNDLLLDLLMDILGSKIKMAVMEDNLLLDKNWVEDMIERGQYDEKVQISPE